MMTPDGEFMYYGEVGDIAAKKLAIVRYVASIRAPAGIIT